MRQYCSQFSFYPNRLWIASFHLLFGLATSGIGLQKNSRSWLKMEWAFLILVEPRVSHIMPETWWLGTFVGIGANFQVDLTMETFYVPEHKKKKWLSTRSVQFLVENKTYLPEHNHMKRNFELKQMCAYLRRKRVKSICASSFFNTDVTHRHGTN